MGKEEDVVTEVVDELGFMALLLLRFWGEPSDPPPVIAGGGMMVVS